MRISKPYHDARRPPELTRADYIVSANIARTVQELWRPISPWSYVERLHDKQTLMVYARYDLSFPVDLSLTLIDEIRRRNFPLEVRVLPCGHYTTGHAPFKYLDGWHLGKFLATKL